MLIVKCSSLVYNNLLPFFRNDSRSVFVRKIFSVLSLFFFNTLNQTKAFFFNIGTSIDRRKKSFENV